MWSELKVRGHAVAGVRYAEVGSKDSREGQAFPNAAREGGPQSDEQAITPVDDDASTTMQNAFDDVACGLFGRNHHGVVAFGDEVGAYETRHDVGDGNVVVSLVGDL